MKIYEQLQKISQKYIFKIVQIKIKVHPNKKKTTKLNAQGKPFAKKCSFFNRQFFKHFNWYDV